MERTILKELTKANVEAYVNRQREAFLKKQYWPTFFPLKYTTQLTWESLTGSGGNPVMADVIEYNSSAPLKSRRVVAKTTGEIPKIAIKRQMDEKDMNDYNILKALSGDTNKSALLDIVFNDIDFCYTGVMARTEYLAMQALSYGQIAFTTSNNNGIITEVACDFGIPAGNKTAVASGWSNATGATPLTDIKDKVENAAASGYPLRYMLMDLTQVNQLIANTEIQNQYALSLLLDDSRKYSPTLTELNNMLRSRMLPEIILVDSNVRFENEQHTISNLTTWKSGYVTFLNDLKVGNILHGPIAEETSASVSKIAIQTKRDHILLSKWSELEPFGEFTKGQANAFPRFTDADSVFLMKTDATSWS